MHSTVKTILIWVLILVIAVGLYNLVERSGSQTKLNLADFLTRVENGGVADVVVNGNLLTGHLANGQSFKTTIPSQYVPIYDKLVRSQVRVTILPPDSPTTEGLPGLLIVGGLVVWFAISAVILILLIDLSRFVKRQLARTNGTGSVA